MLSPSARHVIYWITLVGALVAVLWVGNIVDRYAVPEREVLAFSPPAGAYDHSQLLAILPLHPHSPVVFTTDGTIPSASVGTVYERPLRLDSAFPGVTVVRTREFVDGAPGPIVSGSYIVGVAHTLPILSIIADPVDLWDPERGILANDWRGGQEWERPIHITYIEADRSDGFDIAVGLRVYHDEFSTPRLDNYSSGSSSKQAFALYLRRDYGAARLEYPLFTEHQGETLSYKRLLLQAGDKSGRWTLLDGQLLADVGAEMDGNVAKGRFVLLFLNGEPWGIYRLSERIDRFFLEDQFGMLSADLIQDGNAIAGDDQLWGALKIWIETHDLSDPANYANLQTEIDLDGFTDATILRMYFGLALDHILAARPQIADGRWFWLHGVDQEGVGRALDTRPVLVQPSGDSNDLTLLSSRLLENHGYRAHFVGRVADLLNTVLASASMQARIDLLAGQLGPDIGYETDRWPILFDSTVSSGSEWEKNVAALSDYAQGRPDVLRHEIVTEFGLRGTANLTFNRSADGNGYVVVNGSPIQTLPWSGTYFLDTDVQIIAVPAPGYAFAGWENGSGIASTSRITFTVDAPRTLTARFVPIPDDAPQLRPNDVIINEYWINDNGTRYSSVGGQSIEGDWVELRVTRPRTADLRGWRITDNDTKIATGEGSIILPSLDAFAAVPRGTIILIIATESNANAARFVRDDLDPGDGQMVLYVGNGQLDVTTDPGFNIGPGDDNLVLLAPGTNSDYADDIGVDFVTEGDAVTPLSFGVLADGVTFEEPFQGLGRDDGALFTGGGNNDNGAFEWIVDPAPEQSGDDVRPGVASILTPGAPNYGQGDLSLPTGVILGLLLIGLVGASIVSRLRARRG